jgi:hypothetical protein
MSKKTYVLNREVKREMYLWQFKLHFQNLVGYDTIVYSEGP